MRKKPTEPRKTAAKKRTALSFWYHYNKPASQKARKPKISVHYDKKCHIVDSIVCNVPTAGHQRNTQPHFVVKGKGIMTIKKGIAYIN
ncbi:hypothetical protein ACFS7Z_13720 [Pontibacter toksunensis]|uniref:Uncharacterized protein n=1 Tax=Pontibacter toksunensis TaxID=1332631 RepID=A0ABW6BUD4_9BACT